jgi:hypothetical protein
MLDIATAFPKTRNACIEELLHRTSVLSGLRIILLLILPVVLPLENPQFLRFQSELLLFLISINSEAGMPREGVGSAKIS